jgi:hypothetical protein
VETDLQYNRARYYDATTGRWISQDPMGFDAGDNNLYRYVQNKPTDATDPTGLDRVIIDSNNRIWWESGEKQIYIGNFAEAKDQPGSNLTMVRLNGNYSGGATIHINELQELISKQNLTSFKGLEQDVFRDFLLRTATAKTQLDMQAIMTSKSTLEAPLRFGGKTGNEAFSEANRLITDEFPKHVAVVGSQIALDLAFNYAAGKLFGLFIKGLGRGYAVVNGLLKKEGKALTAQETRALVNVFNRVGFCFVAETPVLVPDLDADEEDAGQVETGDFNVGRFALGGLALAMTAWAFWPNLAGSRQWRRRRNPAVSSIARLEAWRIT